MVPIFGLLGRVLGVAVCICSATAVASIVSVTFDTHPPGPIIETNYTEAGFRISPNCHYDVITGGYGGSVGIGWDASLCFTGGNANYLGPAQPLPAFADPVVYIDAGGHTFTFLSVWISNLSNLSGLVSVESSSGAVLGLSSAGFNYLSGPDWTNIQWLIFHARSPGVPLTLIDQLSFLVPEPAPLALIGLGLAGLAAVRRQQLN